MQKKWIAPLTLFALLLTLGCALPTLPFLDNTAANTAPTAVDADTLATLVADSVAQKVAKTLEALPPTAQPSASATLPPSPTATATEIPPTPTDAPKQYPETGSDIVQEEEKLLYYDYSGNYMITIPPNWLAIRPGEVEYAEAWGLPVAARPEVKTALKSMQSLDPSTFRLFILDVQEGHFDKGFLSNISFISTPENEAGLDEVFAQSVLQLPETIQGLVVTDSLIKDSTNGERMGIIVSEWDAQTASAENIRIFQQQAIFMIEKRALIITFTSTVDFKDTILPDFDALVDSFQLLR